MDHLIVFMFYETEKAGLTNDYAVYHNDNFENTYKLWKEKKTGFLSTFPFGIFAFAKFSHAFSRSTLQRIRYARHHAHAVLLDHSPRPIRHSGQPPLSSCPVWQPDQFLGPSLIMPDHFMIGNFHTSSYNAFNVSHTIPSHSAS